MKRIILFLCLVVCAVSDVKQLRNEKLDLFKYDPSDVYTLPVDIDDEKPAIFFSGDVMKAKVEKLENLNGNKKFKLDLKTQNGIEVSSVGKLKDDKTFVVSGSYSFTGADGKRYRTRYTADEFGYHPITELDLDLPDPQTITANIVRSNDGNFLGSLKNRFQFLNQNLNSDGSQNVFGGFGQSGDDYSFDSHSESGYDYKPPVQPLGLPSVPSRQYLPVQ